MSWMVLALESPHASKNSNMQIFVFDLRFVGKGKPNWPIEAWREEGIDVEEEEGYERALAQAKKEFIRRQNGYLDDIDLNDIEVLNWGFA